MSGLSLDEIVFATGAGATDADTLRVQLSTESLAALENITVSATALDIRALTFTTDTVDVSGSEISFAAGAEIRITDGTDDLAINADGSINVKQGGGASIKHSASSVTTTVGEVLGTPLAGRTAVIIQNEGSANVYVGFNNTVTAANGLKVSKASSLTLDVTDAADIWMIAASGTQDVRFLEIA